jgi:hypothetical protein
MEAFMGLVLGLLFGLAILFILGWVLRWLWNGVLPEVMGVKPITVVQAIKLIFISSILFGGHRVITVDTYSTTTAPTEVRASLE